MSAFVFPKPPKIEVGCEPKTQWPQLVAVTTGDRLENVVSSPQLEQQLRSHPQLQLQWRYGSFRAKVGECCWLSLGEHALLLVGVGESESLTLHRLRRAMCEAGRYLLSAGHSCAQLHAPQFTAFSRVQQLQVALEGLLLGQDPVVAGARASDQFDTIELLDSLPFALEEVIHTSQAVLLARRMVNANADEMTPIKMAQIAEQIIEQLPSDRAQVSCEVLDEVELRRIGCHLILAVGQGAVCPPRLVILRYQPEGQLDPPLLLVGKGVSYDTGGLKLKPGDSMLTMRCDMAGAAAALAVFEASVRLQSNRALVVIMACAENAIGPASYKMGDIYPSYSGKRVEITNTDAEGRLLLADALSYGIARFAPAQVVDVATLTGAMEVALGPGAAGVMSRDVKLTHALELAAERTGERIWPLPLFEEYLDYLKSDLADLKNSGPRLASGSLAALFLEQFVPANLPWAHLDIASVAFLDRNWGVLSKLASGFGVRLLIDWVRQRPSFEPSVNQGPPSAAF